MASARTATTPDLEAARTPPAPSRSIGALKCCLGGLLGIGAAAVYIALAVSSLCFFVSGLVFTIEEFSDIPECAKPYKAWSITMLVVFFSLARSSLSRRKREKAECQSAGGEEMRILGVSLLVVSIFPGLVAGLGSREVLRHPGDSCDVTGSLPQLETWTEWVVCYTWTLMGLLQAAGLLLCFCGRSSSS